MLLPKMTSSARVARAFQRLARGAVVSLALAGLAACGGGGSSKPATPQMTITPDGDTLANAVDITGKETTEGRLDSPDDIQYYQWEAPEDGTFEFTLDADAGLELAILDSGGNVITTAETASPTVIEYALEKGKKLYFRISDKAKKVAGTKEFKFVVKHVGVVQTLVNFIKGDITVELTVAGRGVTIDLNDFVSLPPGADTGAVMITLTTGNGIKLTSRIFQRLSFRLDEPPRPFVGVSYLSVCYQKACTDGVVDFIIRQAVTVKPDYWGSRDEAGYATRGVVSVNVDAPGTWSSQPLGEYFNSPDNTQLSFAGPSTQSQSVLAEIRESRLVVRAPQALPQPVDIVVSARGPQNEASLTFRITIEGEGLPEEVAFSCPIAIGGGCEEYPPGQVSGSPLCVERRPSQPCPRTTEGTAAYFSSGPRGQLAIYSCTDPDDRVVSVHYVSEVPPSRQLGVPRDLRWGEGDLEGYLVYVRSWCKGFRRHQ